MSTEAANIIKSEAPTLVLKAQPEGTVRVTSNSMADGHYRSVSKQQRLTVIWSEGKCLVTIEPMPSAERQQLLAATDSEDGLLYRRLGTVRAYRFWVSDKLTHLHVSYGDPAGRASAWANQWWVMTDCGRMPVLDGDWIITQEDGKRWALGHKSFGETYEAVK